MTAGERSKKHFEALGYVVGKTEHWIPNAKTTKDLFGFADYAAIHPGHNGTLYIQATAGDHGQNRVKKILGLRSARTCLRAGNRIVVQDWRKRKVARGMPVERTVLWEKWITLEDFGIRGG